MYIDLKAHGFFKFRDSFGDGNCFFNSLVLSAEINFSCPFSLRDFVVNQIKKDPLSKEIFHSIESVNHDDNGTTFDSWVSNLSNRGTWQGTTAAVFVCRYLECNVTIVSNFPSGFHIVNIKKWLTMIGRDNFIPNSPEAECIYLFHHVYKRPMLRSSNCNHFGFMENIPAGVMSSVSSNMILNDLYVEQTTLGNRNKEDECIDQNRTTADNLNKKRSILDDWTIKIDEGKGKRIEQMI